MRFEINTHSGGQRSVSCFAEDTREAFSLGELAARLRTEGVEVSSVRGGVGMCVPVSTKETK